MRVQSLILQARSSGVLPLQALVYGAMEIFERISIDYPKMGTQQWAILSNFDNANDASLLFLLSLFRFLVLGLTSRSVPLFKNCLQAFFGRMGQTSARLFFLSLVWNDPNVAESMKIVALKMGSIYMEQAGSKNSWAIQFNSFVIPQLICSLASSNALIRQHALDIFKALKSASTSIKTYGPMVTEIVEAEEELKIDEEQLKVVVARYLTKKNAASASSSLYGLLVSKDVPNHVKQGLLKALEHVNSVANLTKLLPLTEQLITKASTEGELGAIESNILTMLLERFTPESAPILATDAGWGCFQKVISDCVAGLTPFTNCH